MKQSILYKTLITLFILNSLMANTTVTALELSIYSSAAPAEDDNHWNQPLPGYAFIIDNPILDLNAGKNLIQFTEIPTAIVPTSLQFKSLTDLENTQILNQEYRFDLANTDTLLNQSIGKIITAEQLNGTGIATTTGTLLSTTNGLTLKDKTQQIITLSNYSAVRFQNASNELNTQPTLYWEISAKKAGKHKTEIRYQTKEVAWRTDYNAIFKEDIDPNFGNLEFDSWVTIINQSGMNYENANLSLIAGDINSLQTPRFMGRPNLMAAKMMDGAMPEQMTETSLFEYHKYHFTDKVNLPNNTKKQIPFLKKTTNIPVEKLYIYTGTSNLQYSGYPNTDKNSNMNNNSKIAVYLKWKNNEKSGLGIPFPAGRIRVSMINNIQTTPEFIGEDVLNHTPKDEDFQVKMGNAFDVVAERKQLDFTLDNNRHILEETIEITLKNHKDKAVKVIVNESLYRTVNWEILKGSSPFEKINSETIKFPTTINANSTSKVQYTVRYTW